MRSVFSLLALGITLGSTLVTTAGQDLNLKSIRAVDRSVTNKDSWKMKGNIDDPSMTLVSAIGQTGLTVKLQDSANDPLNTVTFAASDCRANRRKVPVKFKERACPLKALDGRRSKHPKL